MSHSRSATGTIDQHTTPHGAGSMRAFVGDSPAIRNVRRIIAQVARSSCNVLITGETGVGKELAARLIHDASPRHAAPFVSLNCAALPETLIESELFGYERGAFTGAHAPYAGKLKLADRGTLFLDEVGEMSLSAQPKLLRAIEHRTVFRLGGRQPVPVDFRLLSATNQDLHAHTHDGHFRLDLYYRLKVVEIALPPLRARREDIPALAIGFLRTLAHGSDPSVREPELSRETFDCLGAYDWPGNVRELHNVIEAALVLAGSEPLVTPDHLPAEVRGRPALRSTPAARADDAARISAALAACRWNKSAAARTLRWSRMTLYRKIAKYRIED
jgi:DNA-binding NtrC family response regulator